MAEIIPTEAARIVRWLDVAHQSQLLPALDDIFFEASNTKSFASAEDRAAFRMRWLGRFLEHDPAWAFLLMQGESEVAGYVVGSLDDPAQSARFSDIGYFRNLAHLTARFPAQLHINLAPEWRGAGSGSRLVAHFAEQARRAGAPGLHVVTSRGARNVGFYAANGFAEAGSIVWNGRELVFLGRSLGPC